MSETTDMTSRMTSTSRPPLVLPLFSAVRTVGAVLAVSLLATGCKGITDVLNVPPPASIQTSGALKNQSGAESILASAKSQLFGALTSTQGIFAFASELSDELTEDGASLTMGGTHIGLDTRRTAAAPGYGEPGDSPLSLMLAARSQLLLAVPVLQRYEPANGQQKVGEAYALVGYVELYTAEDYCAGITLDRPLPDGGWEFNEPLTTDSLLATAEMHFDSALAHANNDPAVLGLANTGLARARLDRGHFADAATAAASVPTSFLYATETPSTTPGASTPNMWATLTAGPYSFSWVNVADREGGNGIDYVSASDPRLVFDTTISRTADRRFNGVGNPLYYPVKFGNPSTAIPLATGAEARLIEAEAAWQAHDIPGWANDLNALRAQAATTYLQLGAAMPPLTTDSTTGASDAMQVSVMFRERAFWLYGTGVRLGDMRRLVRQYQRDQSTVYPTGSYGGGIIANTPNYGTDVDMTLPTPAGGVKLVNPHYKGCLVPTTTA